MNLTHDQLLVAPELGLLAAVDRALDIAVRLLVAAHPELCDPNDTHGQIPLSCDHVRPLIHAICRLRDVLGDFHATVADELGAPLVDPIPF